MTSLFFSAQWELFDTCLDWCRNPTVSTIFSCSEAAHSEVVELHRLFFHRISVIITKLRFSIHDCDGEFSTTAEVLNVIWIANFLLTPRIKVREPKYWNRSETRKQHTLSVTRATEADSAALNIQLLTWAKRYGNKSCFCVRGGIVGWMTGLTLFLHLADDKSKTCQSTLPRA